jgi:(p)ppGpp synthase/HD superfamily hydrolase
MNLLEKAIAIAVQAHGGQFDKSGAPYILHPLRVMFGVSSETERIVAVLHDVVEDSDWTLEQLRAEGFSEPVLAALDCVTKRENEDYFDFIARIKVNQLAITVKISDLHDNMNLARIPDPTEKDLQRLEKYKKALAILTNIPKTQ